MNETENYLREGLAPAREAARGLARCDDGSIREVLYALADKTLANMDEVLEANRSDLSRMPEDDPKYDRLLLNEELPLSEIPQLAIDLRGGDIVELALPKHLARMDNPDSTKNPADTAITVE